MADRIPYIDLRAQYERIREEINQAIQSCLDTSSFVGREPTTRFEEEFATYLNVNHCVGCGNGSDALELALKAQGIGPGDEVLVPALTWIATAAAVSNVGATPVFVDILEGEYTLDPDLLQAKLTSKTKAIIPVHLYGLPARMPEIMGFAQQNRLFVIEDCAQAVGATIYGQKVGTFGDMATFSFYPGKTLGAYGDGGAVVTNDSGLAEKVRMLGNHGQVVKHDHRLIGRNSRLDSIQAAVLSVKLRHLDTWIEQRRELAEAYNNCLPKIRKQQVPDGYDHAYHVYQVIVENRQDIQRRLLGAGIGYAIHYPKIVPHTMAYGIQEEFPVAEKLSSRTISLPIYPEISQEAVVEVCEIIRG